MSTAEVARQLGIHYTTARNHVLAITEERQQTSQRLYTVDAVRTDRRVSRPPCLRASAVENSGGEQRHLARSTHRRSTDLVTGDGDVRAWRVDLWVVNGVRDHWATVGGFTAALPRFDCVDQAETRYRETLISYLENTRLQDAQYRLVVEGPGPPVDPPSVELEFRRSAPLPEIPPHRWGRL
jgi:hypothetical protein